MQAGVKVERRSLPAKTRTLFSNLSPKQDPGSQTQDRQGSRLGCGLSVGSLSLDGVGRLRDGAGRGRTCGSGTGILRGCGDSPALGSGLQLAMQSHREAEEAPWLALLAQGAHHVQIEGDSPWEEQSGKQGAKKVTNPRGPPWIAARSPCHGATPARASRERKEIRSPPESQVSRGGSLVSESRWSFRGSPSLPPRHPSPAAPPPQHQPGQLQRPQPLVHSGSRLRSHGWRPGPALAPPLGAAAGGGRRSRRGMPRRVAPGGNPPSPTPPRAPPPPALSLSPHSCPTPRAVEAASGNGEGVRNTDRKAPKKRSGGGRDG